MSSNNVYRDTQAKFRKVLIHHKLTQVGGGVVEGDLIAAVESAQVSQPISARYSPRDWDEDFSHENGYYSCRCGTCSMMFHGHKRRVTCKECASNSKPAKVSQPNMLKNFIQQTAESIFMSELKTENETLKAENNLLKEVEKGFADLSENLQNDCATLKTMNTALRSGQLRISEERDNLKLRVADLETSLKQLDSLYKMAVEIEAERDRLQNERDALNIAYRRRESIIFPVGQPTSEPRDDLP